MILSIIKPEVFLTVHSGNQGMYMPYGYTGIRPKENFDNMNEILVEIANEYCPACKVGSIGALLGYLSFGNCLGIYKN